MPGRDESCNEKIQDFDGQYSVFSSREAVPSSRVAGLNLFSGRTFVYSFNQKRQKMISTQFNICPQYIGVAFKALSGLPKLCAKESKYLEPSAIKPSHRWIHRNIVVWN